MKQLIPFSNGTEADLWQFNNCQKCSLYEDESTDISEAGCKLAFELDMGRITGTISEEAAQGIGYTEMGDKFVRLLDNCKQFKME